MWNTKSFLRFELVKSCPFPAVTIAPRTHTRMHVHTYLSYGYNNVSFSFSCAAQPGAWGPNLSGACSSFQHLLSNWLNFLCTDLYNNLTSTLLSASVTISHFNSTHPRSRLYLDIPRPDAPVIYTGAFPILTAWPGSICYIRIQLSVDNYQASLFSSSYRFIQILKKWRCHRHILWYKLASLWN